MKRVVVTGMGIVSSIGNSTQEVLASLREAKPGVSRAEKYAELGFRSQVHGAPTLDAAEAVDRRAMRFLGGGAAWNHVAMEQAIRDAGLEPSDVVNPRTGIIMGSGGPSTRAIVEAADVARSKGPKRVGPFAGGCEELGWTLSVLFDAMGAMSSKYNDTPATASRAYDADRDGFVIAGGAGVLVLEELEHAKARGAKIYAEVVGYGATSDGE